MKPDSPSFTQPGKVTALAIGPGGHMAIACGREIIVSQLTASIQ
jgi:hypothetical protein